VGRAGRGRPGFVGIDLTHESAPDAPTLLKFQYIDRQ
jgi:hypothetical protein